jgi:hypothetical protein
VFQKFIYLLKQAARTVGHLKHGKQFINNNFKNIIIKLYNKTDEFRLNINQSINNSCVKNLNRILDRDQKY